MNLLEYYHNQPHNNDSFVPRKCQLPSQGDINLFGVRGSGKTSIVLDIIDTEEDEDYLYINFKDPNLMFGTIYIKELQNYIDIHHIKLLILDDYQEGLLNNFPNVHRLIVLSRVPLKLTGITGIELFPLDYEEFLAFENTSTQNKGFNHFLRAGTLPYLARHQKNISHSLKNFFYSAFDTQEQKLLLILAQHHTKHLTINQIYIYAKEKFKISKDWLYKTMKQFNDESLIFFIDDKYQKSGKKMFLFDFAFAKYLTIGQPFIIQFDTMIVLTLTKHKIAIQSLGIHGYITDNNELIIPAPFESEDSLWVKSQTKFSLYKQYGVRKVTIVTVANSYEYSIEKLNFEALPFDEWSVSHTEI